MTDIDRIRLANQAFYDAHEARDLGAMTAVWERSERAVCVHPGWPILRGWDEIKQSWSDIFSGPGRNQFILTNDTISVKGDTAWVSLDENMVSLDGAGTVAATNLFIRDHEGEWKLTVHHGSPLLSR